MNNKDIPELVKLQIYAHEHDLLSCDSFGQALIRSFSLNVAGELEIDELKRRVIQHKINKATSGNPFRYPKASNGDLIIGKDQHGNPVRTALQYLNAHCLAVGSSGAAKTTLAMNLILEAANPNLGLWMFDLRKREFAKLQTLLAQRGIKLHVIPARKMRFNPLQIPKYVSPEDFAPNVAEMLVQVLKLPPRASKLLHVTILRLYQGHATSSHSNDFPTLFDLFDSIKAEKKSNHPARQAILDSLEPILLGLGRDVLGWSLGWKTTDLAKMHIVFDFSGIAETEKDILLNTLVLSEFSSRLAQGISNQKMNLFLVCDEAARLCRSSNDGMGIDDQIGLIRGTGIGLFLLIQTSDVSSTILSNTSIKFIGRCGNYKDYRTMGDSMGLTSEQMKWMALNLEPGKFVVQLGEGSFRHPFILKTDRIHFPTSSNSSTLANVPNPLAHLSTIASTIPHQHSTHPPTQQNIYSTTENNTPSLSDVELRYLRAVVANPLLPSSQYASIAKVGQNRAMNIRKSLKQQGYLREHQVNTNRRGRSALLLEATKNACIATGQGTTSTNGASS